MRLTASHLAKTGSCRLKMPNTRLLPCHTLSSLQSQPPLLPMPQLTCETSIGNVEHEPGFVSLVLLLAIVPTLLLDAASFGLFP